MPDIKMRDIAKAEKPREKMMIHGVELLSNSELLAILLGTGSSESSVLFLSEEILKKCGGIRGLVDFSMSELLEIKGVGEAKACRILSAIELFRRISKETNKERFQIKSASSVAALFMEELRYEQKEYFKVLFLDTKNRIICDRCISIGSLNASVVHPREVFKEAVRQSANKIFLIHNHPSGDSSPSNEDISITKRLVEVGKLLGVEVLDHIIIGDGNYTSLKEYGYL